MLAFLVCRSRSVPSSPESIQSFQKLVCFLGEDPSDLLAMTTSTSTKNIMVPSSPELRIQSFQK
ncbi:hypothetical protein PGT21_012060 [Puccinia graminis f. sp. tritici]|uniref:Uncharacterized protein n=1 Tax=Puccinia graminis f. sp. tritici TaxID=56615 RepID=A0A5B0P230_PUCGR|nr:hypothetical protein PGT21_012060 [Puccinia graminis f. sp. tritici]